MCEGYEVYEVKCTKCMKCMECIKCTKCKECMKCTKFIALILRAATFAFDASTRWADQRQHEPLRGYRLGVALGGFGCGVATKVVIVAECMKCMKCMNCGKCESK